MENLLKYDMENLLKFNVEFIFRTNECKCVVTNDGKDFNEMQCFKFDLDGKIIGLDIWNTYYDSLSDFTIPMSNGEVLYIEQDFDYIKNVIVNEITNDIDVYEPEQIKHIENVICTNGKNVKTFKELMEEYEKETNEKWNKF